MRDFPPSLLFGGGGEAGPSLASADLTAFAAASSNGSIGGRRDSNGAAPSGSNAEGGDGVRWTQHCVGLDELAATAFSAGGDVAAAAFGDAGPSASAKPPKPSRSGLDEEDMQVAAKYLGLNDSTVRWCMLDPSLTPVLKDFGFNQLLESESTSL